MATNIVKFKSGLYRDINTTTTPVEAGTVYFAIDDSNNGAIYFDKDNTNRIRMSQHWADEAGFATYDSSNQVINATYVSTISFDGTSDTDKVTAILTKGNGNTIQADLPIAGANTAGIINTGAQTLAGNKSLTGLFTASGGAIFSNNNFEYSGILADSTNANNVIWFASTNKKGTPKYNNNFTYNPSTDTLNVTNVTGTASRAIADNNGFAIVNYIQDISVTGRVLEITKGSGASTSYTLDVSSTTIRRWA